MKQLLSDFIHLFLPNDETEVYSWGVTIIKSYGICEL